MGGKGKEKKRG